MKILVLPTATHVARLAARIVADRLLAKPDLVLGCATGRTMESIYDELVELSHAESIDFTDVRTFNLDEYVGLAPSDSRSYHHYMRDSLFRHVNLRADNTHIPNGAAPDPTAEARLFEDRIAAAGGVDLQLLGIGNTGHIGFNEPSSSLGSRTRVVALAPETRVQNAAMFGGDPESVPPLAITMGVKTILESKEALLVVTGAHKAEILARASEGPVTALVTASALQFHPNCTVLADEEAAGQLAGRSYYDHAAQFEPHWREFARS